MRDAASPILSPGLAFTWSPLGWKVMSTSPGTGARPLGPPLPEGGGGAAFDLPPNGNCMFKLAQLATRLLEIEGSAAGPAKPATAGAPTRIAAPARRYEEVRILQWEVLEGGRE